MAKHWFTQAKKLGQGLAADAPGCACWTSLEIALEKNMVNDFFLLKEEKMEKLKMSNKGITFTYKIIFSPC